MNAALLLLADGRFPTGGHAHSAGAEAAVVVGDVTDMASLAALTKFRLHSTGIVDAAFAAAACAAAGDLRRMDGTEDWPALQCEYLARTLSPAQRDTSFALGRQLLRSGRRAWPRGRYAEAVQVLGGDIVQPLAMGLVGHAAGLSEQDTALCELHHLVGALTSAGVRLLGLDPFAVAALAAGLGPSMQQLATLAASFCCVPAADLPADVLLSTDVLAEHHRDLEVRLFAS